MRAPLPFLPVLVASTLAVAGEPTPSPTPKAELEAKQQVEQEQIQTSEEAEYDPRYAPGETLYNLKPLPAFIPNGVTTIPPGSELQILGRKPNGLLKLRCGELETEAALSLLTLDRDVAAKAASADVRNQLLLKQKRMKQAEEFRQQQLQQQRAVTQPTATPRPQASRTPNPLGTPKLDTAR